VISLDYHAYVTTQIINHADELVAYNTSPHVDIYETSRRAFELVTAILTEPISPVIRMQKIPRSESDSRPKIR
jgi:microcystin degradation protein MlrC